MTSDGGFIEPPAGPAVPLESPTLTQLLDLLREVNNQLSHIFHLRMVWRKTLEMLNANPAFQTDLPYFFAIVTELYATSQAAAVRRQIQDRGLAHRNMRRLLHDLELARTTITRQWFRARYLGDPFSQALADEVFDRFSLGGDTVAQAWIDFARRWLEVVSGNVRQYVDLRIAHEDHSSPVVIPTFAELDAVLEALGEVDRQLHLLLLGADLDGPEPIIPFNWAAGLEVPWYTPTGE